MIPLLVDAGNVFFSPKTARKLSPGAKVIGRGIAEIYTLMNYHGVAVGQYDLAAGIDFLKELEKQGLPLLSANIYLDDTRVFLPFRSVDLGSLKVALIGITRKTARKDCVVRDPIEELDKLLPQLLPQHNLLILLFNGPDSEAREIAARYPSLSIIIGSDARKGNLSPVLLGGSLLTQTESQGKYLGALFVDWKGPGWKEDYGRELKQLEKRLKNEQWQLKRLEGAPNQDSERLTKRKSVLLNNIAELQLKIERVQADQFDRGGSKPASTYRSEFFALGSNTGVDRLIDARVKKIKTEKNNAQRTAAQP